jgi:hypothetical protein
VDAARLVACWVVGHDLHGAAALSASRSDFSMFSMFVVGRMHVAPLGSSAKESVTVGMNRRMLDSSCCLYAAASAAVCCRPLHLLRSSFENALS